LADITPSDEENKIIMNIVDELYTRISDAVEKLAIKIKIEPILVGSVAKSTHLTNPDIDIFMMFPESTDRKILERDAIKIGRMVIPEGQERYAEHPYISGKYKGFDVDLVPCYLIVDPVNLKSAVDRTPFHTRYIKENFVDDLIPDVLLLKQFMKGVGVYGAEIEIQGFSGYLCELLVMYYNGFNNLIQSVRNWDAHTLITLTDDPVPEDKMLEFKNDPLIFIDPVDPKRNVASALSMENFELFKLACEKYLVTPKRSFFFPNPIQPLDKQELVSIINSRSSKFIGLVFETPDVIPDILYSQLRKAEKAVGRMCVDKGYELQDSGFVVTDNDNTLILFEFSRFELPSEEVHVGPPDGNKNKQRFIDKWQTSEKAINPPYLDAEDNRWKVKIHRDFTRVQDLILTEITDQSLGKHVGNNIRSQFKLLEGSELVQSEYQVFLTRFIQKKYRWEY
jgi:tRNA nucleotidyltransferase (CCA-adding enzyme)